MPDAPLTGIRACAFDAYGTLFDTAAAAVRCKDALGDKLDRLAALWREKQLQYSWLRTMAGRHADFWQVTGDALDFALDALGVNDDALRTRLMELYFMLDAYPEAPAVIGGLRASGLPLSILSNGSPRMLEAAITYAKMDGVFDPVFSVEEVGAFKTSPKVYARAVERIGVPAASIAFVTANGWDAYAASAFGLRVVWCNRARQPRERLPGAPERIIHDLAKLPELLLEA
jgi:2-haloacid dehalogenase